jgi:hypothetical protein
VVGVPYADEHAEEVRTRLSSVGGVLVWINRIVNGRDRSLLNAVLADVADAGVFVSAHPEIIAKMGTKEVLYLDPEHGMGLRHEALSNLRGDA